MRFFALRLMTRYIADYQKLYALYNRFFASDKKPFTNPIADKVEEGEEHRTYDVTAKNIKKLEQVDPLLWKFAKYSRPVAPAVDLQVMPILPDEVDTYRKMGRDVILWPVDVIGIPDEMQTKPAIDPASGKTLRVFYTTTTQGKPHITLVPNPGPNRATHPMIPKCQESLSDLTIDTKDWSIIFHSKERAKASKDQLKTLKILDVGRSGPVNGSLLKYLNVTRMERLGVARSQSSLLHCVLYAMGSDPNDEDDFRHLYDKPEAEFRVIDVRKRLGRYAVACLQENPSLSVEEIKRNLTDPKVFLDPSRHYRAVEELLGINIFTAIADQNKELILEAPVRKEFYSRSKRRHLQGCVVILKLVPQQSKVNREYQCEVLVTQTPEGAHGAVFTDEVTDKLEAGIDALTQHLLVRPSAQMIKTEEGFEARQTISVETSVQEKIRVPGSFLRLIKAQKVDALGKVRGVQVECGAPDRRRLMWIMTSPLEPLCSLNIGDADDSMSNEQKVQLMTNSSSFPLGDVTPSPASGIAALFATLEGSGIKVASMSYTPFGESLVGIWVEIFGLDGYLPLVPIPWKEDKFHPVRFDCPYNANSEESPTQKLARLQKVLMTFIQIAKRLFALYWVPTGLEFNQYDQSGARKLAWEAADDFMKAYVYVGKPTELQVVTGGKRFIPSDAVKDLDALFDHFVRSFPTLFGEDPTDQQTKLLCDSEKFYENLRERMRNYADGIQRELRSSINDITPEGSSARLTGFQPFLDYFFVNPEDFSVHGRDQMIFMSMPRLQLELKSHVESKPLMIKNINPVLIGRRAPYFYMYDDGSMKALYLVQNVLDGDASRAATLARYWRQNRTNTGFYTPPHMGTADVVELQAPNFKIEDPNAPMIVRYQTGEYAAMLSLNDAS